MLRTQITLGIILMIATVGTLVYVGATEEHRMAVTTDAQLGRRIENGATLFHTNCLRCHGERAEGVPGLCPPLNNRALLEQRVVETGWTGSLHTFLVNTIRGGRLTSTQSDYVGESANGMAMPFWSQDYGGPLRNDQIEDIAYYLENFPEGEVEAVEATPIPEGGEIEAGLALYQSNGCVGCHQLDAVSSVGTTGPTHNGMGATAAERIADPAYAGEATTAEEYIRESIVNPAAHIVEGYQNVMPAYGALAEDQLNALVQMLLAQ